MKPSSLFIILLLSISLYVAQGIRLEKSIISASNHQEIITKTPSSNQEDEGLAMAADISTGISRKLMTKTISSSSSSTANDKDYKNDESNAQFTRELVEKEEKFPTTKVQGNSKHGKTKVVADRYPDVIDITGMDYSPAKRKPPIHN